MVTKNILLPLVLIISATLVFAEKLEDVVIDTVYYKKGWLSDKKVTVVKVDKVRRKVQVVDVETREVEWVNSDSLISYKESIQRTRKKIGDSVEIIASIFEVFNETQIEWKPGKSHPKYPNVVASTKENTWIPAEGYEYKDPKGSWEVYWLPGKAHSKHENVITGTTPNKWSPASGYEWKVANTLWEVRWSPGKAHPKHKNLVADITPHKWSPAHGYKWIINILGPSEAEWVPGIKYSADYPEIISSDTPDIWLTHGGVGVMIALKGDYPIITKVHYRSPAKKAGLEIGILIMEIDGISTKEKSLASIVSTLSGDVGTIAHLSCLNPTTYESKSFQIKRETFRIYFKNYPHLE